MLFPTTLVGSYPQPEWLIDRKKLAGRFPPRVRARELWRMIRRATRRHFSAEAGFNARESGHAEVPFVRIRPRSSGVNAWVLHADHMMQCKITFTILSIT